MQLFRSRQCETGSFGKQPVGGHPCERISWTKGCLELLLCCLQPHGVVLSFHPPPYPFICSFQFSPCPSLPWCPQPVWLWQCHCTEQLWFLDCNQMNLSAFLSSFVPACLMEGFESAEGVKGCAACFNSERKNIPFVVWDSEVLRCPAQQCDQMSSPLLHCTGFLGRYKVKILKKPTGFLWR